MINIVLGIMALVAFVFYIQRRRAHLNSQE